MMRAKSMGMAKPMPSTLLCADSIFMEAMPTTSPSRLMTGPPLLPTLTAASV